MIARLKDQPQIADRDEAEAARLLGVLSPSAPDPDMESRVYARLAAQPRPAMQRRWVMACVGLLLVSTTILAAALVHRWMTNTHRSSSAAPANATVLAASERATPRPASEPAEPASVGSSPPAAAPAALPGVHPTPPRPVHAGTVRHRSAGPDSVAAKHEETATAETQAPATEAPSNEARMAAAPSEEAAMVLAAMRSLRRGHDPLKAGALLEQYLDRFPRGALVEEALALGMEAALDRNDATAARRLADRYVQHYPAGRFNGLARRAMGGKGP
jgi:hypothetical protein